jgi:hypothetical protein
MDYVSFIPVTVVTVVAGLRRIPGKSISESDEIDGVVLDTLRHCFFRFPPFKFSLRTINQFAGETLYLAPEPGDPFRELTLGIWGAIQNAPRMAGDIRRSSLT